MVPMWFSWMQQRPLVSHAARAWRAEMLGLPLVLASRPSNRNRTALIGIWLDTS